MHHTAPYTRRTFCSMALGTCAALLLPCPAFASIAQGVGKPVSDEALNADFAGLCEGAEQMLAGQRPAQDVRAMLAEAKKIHARLLPLPDIGGPENLTYPSFLVGPQYAALYTAMRPCGFSARDVGKLVYDLAVYGMAAEPQVYRANGQRFFTPEYFALMQAWAQRSQQRRHAMDWVLTVFKGDGRDFDMGVDYTECGLVKYFAALGMPELAPYPCQIDFPTSRAEGTGLERTTTLASGGKVCDFRYKQGRAVTRGWDL